MESKRVVYIFDTPNYKQIQIQRWIVPSVCRLTSGWTVCVCMRVCAI